MATTASGFGFGGFGGDEGGALGGGEKGWRAVEESMAGGGVGGRFVGFEARFDGGAAGFSGGVDLGGCHVRSAQLKPGTKYWQLQGRSGSAW